jgi:4-hydroxy-2-oxoheptanedioate aldolase
MMAGRERLNSVIRAFEAKVPAFASFATADISTAISFRDTAYDNVVFEMEHQPWDALALRDSLQYLLDRRLIADSGSVASTVTPFVRVPANGGEMNQWMAKQALDMGCYGIVWPHIATVDEARAAVAACRYPRPKGSANYEPAGLRGDSPTAAARYWGISLTDYYDRADVWPLDPNGEILCVIMIEDVDGIENLDAMLRNVPGIGLILIGQGDLSRVLGVPREYDHPKMLAAKKEVIAICKKHGVRVGRPQVDATNVESSITDGFDYLMAPPERTLTALSTGLKFSNRSK